MSGLVVSPKVIQYPYIAQKTKGLGESLVWLYPKQTTPMLLCSLLNSINSYIVFIVNLMDSCIINKSFTIWSFLTALNVVL